MSYRLSLRRGPFAPAPVDAKEGVSVLGPYRVNFDDEGIADPGFDYGNYITEDVLLAGTVILELWAERVTEIEGNPALDDVEDTVFLALIRSTDLSSATNGAPVKYTGLANNQQGNTSRSKPLVPAANTQAFLPTRIAFDYRLGCQWQRDSGSFIAGAIDVYAVVVAPS